MRPFVHNDILGAFFDVLNAPVEGASRETTVRKGATTRQEAIVSVISGDINLEQLPVFAATLQELLTSTVQVIVLDLSRITLFCPNAASVLVNFVSFVEGGGKRLVLYRPGKAVQAMLDALYLTHLFDIQHNEDRLLLNIPD